MKKKKIKKKKQKFLEHCKTPKNIKKIFFIKKKKNQCFCCILT